MDTHVSAHADIAPDLDAMDARLPGETEGPAASPMASGFAGRLSNPVGKTTRWRGKLFAGAAVVAVVTAAGGAFLISPYGQVASVPPLQGSVSDGAQHAENAMPPIVAPAASLAKVSVPPKPTVMKETYTPKPRGQQFSELLSLRSGTGATVAAMSAVPTAAPASGAPAQPGGMVSGAGPAVSDVPHEPGTVSAVVVKAQDPSTATQAVSGAKDATDQVATALGQGAQTGRPAVGGQVGPIPEITPGASLPPSASARPVQASITSAVANAGTVAAGTTAEDAVSVAATLRAAPMASPEQIAVLNLVSEMAAMVKDLRRQNADLRADFAKSSAGTAMRLTDFERRLTFAEAKSAVAAASDASLSVPVAAPGPAVSPSPVTPIAVKQIVAAASVRTDAGPLGGGSTVPKTYRVQAASPRLALLAQTDRGGGEGAQLQVAVGDTVPDYGRVKSIGQKGTTWIVTTERGQIQ